MRYAIVVCYLVITGISSVADARHVTLAWALRDHGGPEATRVLRTVLANDRWRVGLARYNNIDPLAITSRNLLTLAIPDSVAVELRNSEVNLNHIASQLVTDPQQRLPRQLMQTVAMGVALLTAPLLLANAEDGSTATASNQEVVTQGEAKVKEQSPSDEVFRSFSNYVYTWYTNYDAASYRSTVLNLGVRTSYEASTPTIEGSVGGWFMTQLWKRVSNDNSADWHGFDDFGVRLKVAKGARVPGSSGTLMPFVYFSSGGSYYEFYKVSADATASFALRWRTRIFNSRKSINIMVKGGGGGLLFHPFQQIGEDTWGFQSQNWDLVGTYGVQFDTDTITIGDLLGMEKQSVFAKIPFLPGLDGEYQEFREWGNFSSFYRTLVVTVELTEHFGLRYELRRRNNENPYKRITGQIHLEDLF